MNWQPIQRLYEDKENIGKVYCGICKQWPRPTHFANTELSCDYVHNTCSRCNIAIKLECGHIVVDDCNIPRLNSTTFANEAEWRKGIVTQPLTR